MIRGEDLTRDQLKQLMEDELEHVLSTQDFDTIRRKWRRLHLELGELNLYRSWWDDLSDDGREHFAEKLGWTLEPNSGE